MSGFDDQCDGKLRLRTEVRKHRSGDLVCPSNVEHVVHIDNVSVCDLQVSFVSTPEDCMLRYMDDAPWEVSFALTGASSPRKDRSERREKNLAVEPLVDDSSNEVRSDLNIESTAQFMAANGKLDGPLEESVRARLRLTLRPLH
jgi:hypothetical protein